ncbi:pyridine nucleotide-disulfide oxidoreductase-domain-containing protein [Lasiosphaeris hirsuta]|uniref:Pyridine nucleotide-disulfide oxidoreductase-domain-containing protein n=1 Tax=Lasiosphaeris hirsuta TaxID=260670 RepID=A0AA40BAU8_9PEZI|nr:pyridine nucleotide-disulfide oxidoreductase-domain-containing protein [Lasiosphaeris hirsuta]
MREKKISKELSSPKKIGANTPTANMHLLSRRACNLIGRSHVRIGAHCSIRPSTHSVFSAFSAFSVRQHHVAAIVIGAGPAGIGAVGNLMEHLPKNAGKIAWIDPEFRAGRLWGYSDVPSNTAVRLFLDYARAIKPLREISEAAQGDAVRALEALPQEQTCPLRYAASMLELLSDGLAQQGSVERLQGNASGLNWNSPASHWEVRYSPEHSAARKKLTSPIVVYCTGSSPATVKIDLPESQQPPTIPLVTALMPGALNQWLAQSQKHDFTVGVIGASHSAIIILMNLIQLAQAEYPRLRVRWFARSPELKYAVPQDGWILYDNTGLKGLAAEFARKNLDGHKLETSEAGKVVTRVDCSGGAEAESAAIADGALQCDAMVHAVGFNRNPFPGDGQVWQTFNHSTGTFTDSETGLPMLGVYGAGIAFPEKIVDPAGNVEYGVGFWKFMRFLKRVTPDWVERVYGKDK